MPVSHRRIFALLWALSSYAWAQIAPECEGLTKTVDYNEDKQRAYLQNYYNALFMQRPLIMSSPKSERKHAIGLDMVFLPKLSCKERLVMNATKTEEAPKTPILPRPRLSAGLWNNEHIAISADLSFLPPLPIPHFQTWYVSGDTMFAYEPVLGLSFYLRAFLGIGYVRAEIAGPFNPKDPIKDDWFSFAHTGGDASVSYVVPITKNHNLRSTFSFGVIKGASIFVVGDDNVPVPNEAHALLSPTMFLSVAYQGLNDRLLVNLSGGGALKTTLTAYLMLGYGF